MMDFKLDQSYRLTPMLIGCLSSAVSFLLILYASDCGISISPDSVAYFSAADNLQHGSGFTLYDGRPMVAWPPLFPVVLAGLELAGIDPVAAAPILNALTTSLTVFVAARWLLTSVASRVVAVAGLALVSISSPLIFISRWLWTESLFVLFTCVALVLLSEFMKGRSRTLMSAAVFVALALLTRYAGIALLATGICVVLIRRKGKWRQDIIEFTVLAAVPIGLWLGRNLAVTGTLMGERAPSQQNLVQTIWRSVDVMSKWFLPVRLVDSIGTPRFVVILIGIIVVTGLLARNRLWWSGVKATLSRSENAPFALFFLVYLVFMLVSGTWTAIDRLDDRLLVPLYVPLVFLLMTFADDLGLPKLRMSGQEVVRAVNVLLLTLLVASSIYITVTPLRIWGCRVEGYNGERWRASETIAYLRENGIAANLYSNMPDVLYFLLGKSANWLPRKTYYNSSASPVGELELFEAQVTQSETPYYVVWFNVEDSYMYSADELRQTVEVRLVTVTADGEIYEVRPQRNRP